MMKIVDYFKHSLSARFSLFIMGVVGLVFAVAFVGTYTQSARSMEAAAGREVQLTLSHTTTEIEGLLTRISRTVDNLAVLVSKEELCPDSLYVLVHDFVSRNEEIVGSAIALEPNHYPEQGYYFSPYACRQGDSVIAFQLGNADYDYFSMEWYQIPRLLGRSYWSEPYFDDSGADQVICTYSAILTRPDGRFMGVMTADVALDWLSERIQAMKPYPNAYAFVLGCSGTYIVHKDPLKIFNESIFSAACGHPQEKTMRFIGQAMVDGRQGYYNIDVEGVSSSLAFAPIPETGWSVALVNRQTDVYAGLNALSRKILVRAALLLVLLFAASLWVIRRMTSPIKDFAHAARQIATGDFDTALPLIRSQDEMRELYDSFDRMKTDLVHYMDSLAQTAGAKEKIESELRIARNIQMGMIPKIFPPFPYRHDVDLYAILRPAKEVGGDLYDFFIQEEKLYFAIGDVSGKGIPASLFMAVTRSLFRSVSASYTRPSDILNSMNRAISETNDENMFVTMFVGILDLASGHLLFSNAGHNPPCLCTPNGQVAFMDLHKNLPIGLFQDFSYDNQEMDLPAGTLLFLYTDGVTEAENATQDLFGEEPLLQALRDQRARGAQPVLEGVYDSVEAHVQASPQSDDLTMLAIKYYGTMERDIPQKVLTLQNQVQELNKLTAFIEELTQSEGWDPALGMSLNLALEEAVSNVIFYAYPKGESHHSIEVAYSCDHNELCFEIRDYGVPFDPTAKKDADVSLGARERSIGGLGIYLVKQIMDTVRYQRAGERNILTLKKKL